MGKSSLRSKSSTHADRKFEKKLQFYAKVRDTVASLSAQKAIGKKKRLRSRQKKLKAYDLSSLSEFLPELKVPSQSAPAANFKVNSKSRTSLLLKEANQMRTVLNHHVFLSDPLAAIHQHLQSTQPVLEKQPIGRRSQKSKAKKKKSKTSSGPHSMEV